MDIQWHTAAQELTAQMTLEEKASLCSGKDFWNLKGIERLNLPEIMVTDGPHGLRKQSDDPDHLGLRLSVPSTCFPPAVTMACTWDPDLIENLGRALAEESREEGVSVVLGPGANIKRSPLCGRNFEYFSEDPFLTGELALAHIRGVQSGGIGTSLKHFAVNNQETNRLFIDAVVDERTLREIYLPGFEKAVKEGQPDTVMCAYNRLNGTYCSENEYLLTTILRDQWGFTGMVVSDWGAVSDRVKGIQAGLDLEMPASRGENDRKIIEAVKSGALAEELLDRAAVRITALILKSAASPKSAASRNADHPAASLKSAASRNADQPAAGKADEQGRAAAYDRDQHHNLARTIAAEGIVLLKNQDNLLPITCSEEANPAPPANTASSVKTETPAKIAKIEKIAVIGDFARNPRYQGAGSSQVNPTRLDSALEAIIAAAEPLGIQIAFARGYDPDKIDNPEASDTSNTPGNLEASDTSNTPDNPGIQPEKSDLAAEACRIAADADLVLLFAGLPDSYESEGFDRTHMRLPKEHNQLIRTVAKANPKTAVILSNGAPVEMPWADSVPAILETYLGGQSGGSAAADVLFGKVNPSGHLAETFPVTLADTPCSENFPGGRYRVQYREGLHIGYRWYASANKPVRFPFGHGLSYTTFTFSSMELSRQSITLKTANPHQETTPLLEVSVTVKNTGQRSGKEVVQIYIRPKNSSVYRPEIELKGFAKVLVEPGESAIVTIPLDARAFSFYNTDMGAWAIETGNYEILAGSSSESIHLTAAVQILPEPGNEKTIMPLQNRESQRGQSQQHRDPQRDPLTELPPFFPPDIEGKTYSDTAFAALLRGKVPQDLPLEDTITLNTPLRDLRGTAIGEQLHAGLIAGLAQMFNPKPHDTGTETDTGIETEAEVDADTDADVAETETGTEADADTDADVAETETDTRTEADTRNRQSQQKMIRMFEKTIEGLPLRGAALFSGGAITFAQLEGMIRLMNQQRGTDK